MLLNANPAPRAREASFSNRKSIPAVVHAWIASKAPLACRPTDILGIKECEAAIEEKMPAIKRIAPNVIFPQGGRYRRMNSNRAGRNNIPWARMATIATIKSRRVGKNGFRIIYEDSIKIFKCMAIVTS